MMKRKVFKNDKKPIQKEKSLFPTQNKNN